MRITLVTTSLILALICVFQSPSAEAAEYGTLKADGIEMAIEGAVAVWRAEHGRLTITLLPFQPNQEEIDLIRKGRETKIEHELVDPDQWPYNNPRGSFTLSWFEEQDRGDFSKANLHVYSYAVGEVNQNLNLNYMMSFVEDDKVKGSMSGSMKPGETVHVTSQGRDELSDSTLVWNFDIKTKVYSTLPRD